MPAPIELSSDTLSIIEKLFHDGKGARYISKRLEITRHMVQKAYKILNLDTTNKQNLRKKIPYEKQCINCNIIKQIHLFRKREKKDRISYESICLSCERQRNILRTRNYYIDNKDNWKIYRELNKDKINSYRRNKIATDVNFKIRTRVSCAINQSLNAIGKRKSGSCLSYLPYGIDELKNHLESKFESWMTWNNWGQYKPSMWDDNDFNTWTWQIDHIIPTSKFIYTSMEDDEFIKCWSLNNLRPLSSKKNIMDGNRR